MSSRIWLCSLFLFCVAAPAFAQQDPIVLGKKRSEWIVMFQTSPDAKSRRAALIALEALGPRNGVLDALDDRLADDPEPEIRREIALTLGRMGPDAKESVAALGEALRKDKSDLVREAAARALGGKLAEFADTQVIVLADALRDPSVGTQSAAAEALKNMGEGARFALPQVTAAAQNPMTPRITRIYAIQIVGRLGDEKGTVKILEQILAEGEAQPGIREAALDGLGRLGATSAIPAIANLLQDKSVEVRRGAIQTLGKFGEKTATVWPNIKNALGDTDGAVRVQAIRLAGIMAKTQPDAIAPLSQAATSDPIAENRLAAIQVLGDAGPAALSALPVLNDIAANETRRTLREAAQDAVKSIHKQN